MKIVVIGAGKTGTQLTISIILNGFETVLVDIDQDTLRDAVTYINEMLSDMINKSEISVQQKSNAQKLLKTTTNLEQSVLNASIVIDCVPEDSYVKSSLITKIHANNHLAVICTTSIIDTVDSLTEFLQTKDKVIGTYFATPILDRKIVEITMGSKTSQGTCAKVRDFFERIGKVSILVDAQSGLVSLRMQIAVILETIRLLEQKCTSLEELDDAAIHGAGLSNNPLRTADEMGLDKVLLLAHHLQDKSISPAFEVPSLLKSLVAEKKLGRKSNEGFYKY